MKFSRWLSSLSVSNQISIILLAFVSGLISYTVIKLCLNRYNIYRKKQPFAPEMHLSPFGLFSLTIPLTFFLYIVFGDILSNIIEKIGN